MEAAAAPVDLLVVGAGPVGLACALEAARQGLSHIVIEKGALLDTLVHWPTHTIFFSTAGSQIGKLFIENGRLHAVAIVKHLLARRGMAPAAPLAAPRIRRFQDGD